MDDRLVIAVIIYLAGLQYCLSVLRWGAETNNLKKEDFITFHIYTLFWPISVTSTALIRAYYSMLDYRERSET